ncbi:MAG: hypothetical protein KDI06_15060, partial [Calditrichaeota bacterium]|nr:hypothetical protein [Calditrichota bacterium]
RSCLRNGFLATLTLVSGALLAHRKPDRSSQVCWNQGICCGCGAVRDCILPQAQSARAAQQQNTCKG